LPTSDDSSTSSSKDTSNRKAGKQHGAQGYGRTQELIAHAFERHAPERCAICDAQLVVSDDCKAWTGWLSVDIAARSSGLLGITFFNTHHLMLSITCNCGHENRAEPYKAPADDAWPGTEISEWRLVGSRLAGMIVLLSQRHYQSRARIKEFLLTFTGLELSIGTIDKTIREAGRSVEPLEDELVRDIEQAALLHADETSWKESGKTLWLWVFVCSTTILFRIGGRGRELFAELLLNGRFKGALMTDGWKVYREYLNRLRCWAHLDRKIKGLTESLNRNVEHVGLEIKALFDTLKIAIYEARSQVGPPKMGLEIRYAAEIETLRQLCLSHKDSRHDKLKAFSREMLNDWDVIMRQVREPWMPLTNNDAERVLRPCVIGRRLSNGTRKAQGTRSFGLLASVIETSRRRKAQTWEFLTSVIDAARKGLAIPSMPLMGV
jgi:IS1 family transposase